LILACVTGTCAIVLVIAWVFSNWPFTTVLWPGTIIASGIDLGEAFVGSATIILAFVSLFIAQKSERTSMRRIEIEERDRRNDLIRQSVLRFLDCRTTLIEYISEFYSEQMRVKRPELPINLDEFILENPPKHLSKLFAEDAIARMSVLTILPQTGKESANIRDMLLGSTKKSNIEISSGSETKTKRIVRVNPNSLLQERNAVLEKSQSILSESE
jgi:hypothetical protein